MSYKDLEEQHDLHDVLAPEKYRHKVDLMEVVLEDLRSHRARIQGRDLMPGFNEARLWSTILSSYSLLEQSLKLLVGVRTIGYLPPANGKNTAINDNHDLLRVYNRLTKLDETVLEETYAEYARPSSSFRLSFRHYGVTSPQSDTVRFLGDIFCCRKTLTT